MSGLLAAFAVRRCGRVRRHALDGECDILLGDQISRIVLLLAATLFAAVIVIGARPPAASVELRRTDAYTSRLLEERLIEELLRASRYGRSLSVAILDVDGFKQFNAPRPPGRDAALRTVVGALRGRRGALSDIVARYGVRIL